MEMDVFGPLSIEAAMVLGWEANRIIQDEPKIVHVNKALFCFSRQATVAQLSNQGEGLYGAIVCRVDQMQITRDFCALMAQVGVLRVAFLSPVLAQEWLAGIV